MESIATVHATLPLRSDDRTRLVPVQAKEDQNRIGSMLPHRLAKRISTEMTELREPPPRYIIRTSNSAESESGSESGGHYRILKPSSPQYLHGVVVS